jgi:hypothetical protein
MTDGRLGPTPSREVPGGIDACVPNSARIWNYWLGGKDNFPADQAAADQFRGIRQQCQHI